MKETIYDTMIKITTVIFINIIFLFFYGVNDFKILVEGNLNYMGFYIIIIVSLLPINYISKSLLIFNWFKTFMKTIIGTVLVTASSLIGLAIYLLCISENQNIQDILFVFGFLLLFIFLISSLILYIENEIKDTNKLKV